MSSKSNPPQFVQHALKRNRRYTETNAAVHDSQVLEAVWQPESARREVWADSAYRSQETVAMLKTQHLRSHIQAKGYRNKPLTSQQKDRNRRRARVEHVFGHQVTAMGGKLIRTIRVVLARAKIGLKKRAYNFQRFLLLTAPSRRKAI